MACRPDRLVMHYTSPEEQRESRDRFPGIPGVVIPNGVSIPDRVGHDPGDGTLRLLFLGRLDPIKGLDCLLRACAGLDRSGGSWRLTIAGDGSPEYRAELAGLISSLGLGERVALSGAVERAGRDRLFAESDLLILPSHRENFGMVVAEALAHAVPVVAAKGTPWRRLEEVGCGLWVENEPSCLGQAIERMARADRRRMGVLGREWMQREYSWKGRAEAMGQVYAEILTAEAPQR